MMKNNYYTLVLVSVVIISAFVIFFAMLFNIDETGIVVMSLYVAPIISFFFFINFVLILKHIKNDEPVWKNTILGAFMFAFLVFCIVGSALL